MRVTVYGKRDNPLTERVRVAMADSGLRYDLVEEFEYCKDRDAGLFLVPYEEHGVVYIPKTPTMRVHDDVEIWVHGVESCLELIGGLCARLYELH